MGVWWKRTTAAGAIAGMIAGFGLCLFYLVATRYFPGFGVKYSGMTSLLNPVTGAPLVDSPKAMALPNAMETSRRWPTRWPTKSAGSTSTTSPADCWACRSASS